MGLGTLFRWDAGGLEVLHSFREEEGRQPITRLVQDGDGALYGSLAGGGEYAAGAVFKWHLGTLTRLHSFGGTPDDGAVPTGTMLLGADGALYGRTGRGGVEVRAQLTPGNNPSGTVVAVEFYNASLQHYFISTNPVEINALDTGYFIGWERTGLRFLAYASPVAGANPVCRFYRTPAYGDSHFYSASPAECADVRARFPSFVYESPAVMFVALPDLATGECPAGTQKVYRVWNNRADSNHRYTADPAVKAMMLARGYIAEGYGPDAVIMCGAV